MIRDRAEGPIEDVEYRGEREPRPTPEALDGDARGAARSSSARRTRCSRSTRSSRVLQRRAARGHGAGRRGLAARARRRCSRGRPPTACAWAGRTLDSDGIVDHYEGLIDALVADQRAEHVPTLETDVELNDPEARRRVAREVLEFAAALA